METMESNLQNPLVILDRKDILSVLKKHWTANHESLADPERFVEEFFACLLDQKESVEFSAREVKKIYKKKLKEFWKEGSAPEKPKDMFLEIIDSQLEGVEVVLDFGCGKLAFLSELAACDNDIRKFIGVDTNSQPVLEGLDRRIEFQRSLEGIGRESVDLAVIKLVLHHLENEEEIMEIFRNIKNVLRPGGKIVVFEESFPESVCDMDGIENYLKKFNLELSEVTEDFLSLSEEDKIDFLFLNDWLMNVQNPYMPWTGQYLSIEHWKRLGESAGFAERESHFLGAIRHRKRKQGMTAYMVWEK